MKNTYFTLLALSLLSLQQSHAASTTINGSNILSPGLTNAITDSSSTPIATGQGLISVGYFPLLTDSQVGDLVTNQNYSSLVSAFNSLQTGSFGNAAVLPGADGFYDIGLSNGDPLDYIVQGGKNFYTFYQSTGTLTAGSGELGLFRHFVEISSADPSPAIDSYALENYSAASNGLVLIGNTAQINHPQVGLTSSLQLIGVPEPSTALLGLLGFAGLMRRRR